MGDIPRFTSRLIAFDELVDIGFKTQSTFHRFDFFQPSWICAWNKAYVPSGNWDESLGMVAFYQEDGFLGGVGLGVQRVRGIKVASLGGYYWPYRTVCSFVSSVTFGAACDALVPALEKAVPARALRLGPVSSNDPFLGMLANRLKDSGWTLLRKTLGNSYCLSLPETYEQLTSTVSRSLIKNVAYQSRRLSKLGGDLIARRILLSDMQSKDFDDLSKIEEGSWLAEAGGDLKFSGKQDRDFWSYLSESPPSEHRAVFWILYSAGMPFAYSAHLESSDCVYIFANGYLERFSQYSPGAVLSSCIFKDLISRRVKLVDWGMGDSGYKSRWGARPQVQVFDCLLLRLGLFGVVLKHLPKNILNGWSVCHGFDSDVC